MIDLLSRLRAHVAMMAPHQRSRKQGQLLIEATEALLKMIIESNSDAQDEPDLDSAKTRYILNSAVITAPGEYIYLLLSDDEARAWAAAGEFQSTVGYEQTAEALSLLLGMPVPVDRKTIAMKPGDEALVFRLVFPEGTQRIAPDDKGRLEKAVLARHYECGLLLRVT